MLRRRQSVEQFLQTLTKENVNTYRYYGVVDDTTVPLYAAINREEEDAVEAILKLHPNVFLGVEGEDQKSFEQTAIGLAYTYHGDDDIGELMEKYIEEVLGFKGGVSIIKAKEMWEEQRKPKKRKQIYRTKSYHDEDWIDEVHPAYINMDQPSEKLMRYEAPTDRTRQPPRVLSPLKF